MLPSACAVCSRPRPRFALDACFLSGKMEEVPVPRGAVLERSTGGEKSGCSAGDGIGALFGAVSPSSSLGSRIKGGLSTGGSFACGACVASGGAVGAPTKAEAKPPNKEATPTPPGSAVIDIAGVAAEVADGAPTRPLEVTTFASQRPSLSDVALCVTTIDASVSNPPAARTPRAFPDEIRVRLEPTGAPS